MSGDQQPRKRKEKRKKKDSSAERSKAEAEFIARKFSVAEDSDEGSSPARSAASSNTPSQLGEGDSIIHVHHEHGTGGHWCAKIIFFLLLGVLVGLIGLIIAENRGLTDLDTPVAESRFSQVFDGWVDEGPFHDDHHDDHTLELKHPDDEHDEDDEHDDADIENIEEEHQSEDEDEHDEDDEEEESDDGDDDDDEHLEHDDDNESAEKDDDNDDSDGPEDKDDDDEYLDNDEADKNDDDDGKDDQPDNPEDEDDDDDIREIDYNGFDDDDDFLEGTPDEDNDEDDGDDENTPLEEIDSNEENVVENHASEEEHLEAIEAKKLSKEEEGEEEEVSNLGLRLGIGLALFVAAYCLLARRLRSASNHPEVVVKDSVVQRRMTLIDNRLPPNDEDEEEEEADDNENANEEGEESPVERDESKPSFSPLFNPKAAEMIKKYIEDDVEEEIVPQKIKPAFSKPEPKIVKPPPVIEKPVEKVVPPPEDDFEDEDIEEIHREEVEGLQSKDEEVEDEALAEEEEEEELELEEEEEEIEEEEEEELSEEIDDSELMRKLEEKYGKLPERDDELEEPSQPTRPTRKRDKPSGEQAVDDSSPDNWESLNDDNWKEQLDLAQAEMDEGRLEEAYRRFTALMLTKPDCPLAKLGRARSLENLAEKKRSNHLLQQAIDFYKELLNEKKINDSMFISISEKIHARQKFMGKYLDSVPTHKALIARFPDVPQRRNDLAITYLMSNKVNESREVLKETLKLWPNNGVALVHYGFILKTVDNNLVDAVTYLQKGVDTKENGTIDGRFFFHLGDACARLGQKDKARQVYELGASAGVFLSPDQRSLYNVDRLTGRPWWEPDQTPYASLIKELENNWEEIAAEALKLRVQYKPEQENLKDTGDWSQFELFIRGVEVKANCARCPKTCAIVRKEKAARGCRRGQIKFSAMTPGTHVFAHTGPTNCRLRAHLGLTGTKDTYLRVSKEIRSWQVGKVIIFDDSFEHEVWHNGTDLRIVLIVDLWHPELTVEERASLPSI